VSAATSTAAEWQVTSEGSARLARGRVRAHVLPDGRYMVSRRGELVSWLEAADMGRAMLEAELLIVTVPVIGPLEW